VIASHQRRYHGVTAIVQSQTKHIGIEPKAFFNDIGQNLPRWSLAGAAG
jgi:hypothetical protein